MADNIDESPPDGKPILRDYQNQLVYDIRSEYASKKQKVLAVLPTGGGKTHIFCYIVQSAAEKGSRILILIHRREILRQIVDRLNLFGIYPGEIHPDASMTNEPVQVGMVQTTIRRLKHLKAPDFIVIDEAHHTLAKSYQKIIEAYPEAKLLGVTATPLLLTGRGLGETFETMVQGPNAAWLIENGSLSSYRYLAPPTKIDLDGVKTSKGDYDQGQLAAAMDKPSITGDAVKEYKQNLDGKPVIAFCVSIAHSYHVAEAFNTAGYKAAVIEGATDPATRKRLINDLSTGNLHVLASCEVISEGFDVPIVQGAILLRPTKSLAMFLQQVGRALRPKPDGSKAIILDHVQNVEKHGLPDDDREWTLDGIKKKAPSNRTCEMCYQVFAPGKKIDCSIPDCPMVKEEKERERKLIQVEGELKEFERSRQTVRAGYLIKKFKESGGVLYWGGNKIVPYHENMRDPQIVGLLADIVHVQNEILQLIGPRDWTNGKPIGSKKPILDEIISLAGRDREKLEQIRIARGYKSGWTFHQLSKFNDRV